MTHSKNRRSARKKTRQLNFQSLEPRKMLAGDVCLSDGANLIANGNFETFTNVDTQNIVNSFATARFYDSELVPQWTVVDGDGDGTQRINLLTFDNDRGTVLDVDSIPNQDDRVYQDVEVVVGQDYLLSFDFFGPEQVEGVSDPATNNFEVYYNGELLGALDGVARFQKATFVVTGAANDSGTAVDGDEVLARIEFRDGTAGDRGGDGRGALIDEVSLVAVTEETVVNGDFESSTVAGGESDLAPDDVDGFSLFIFSDDAEPRVIELQNEGDGNFLNLNSSPELIDQVFQDFDTEAGQAYFVTFDLRVDPTSDLEPDELRVRFDNQFAANVIGNDQWQSYGVLVEATSETSRLTFREAGEDPGDGASPQIDNLRFFRVDDVAPPVNDLVVDANGSAEGLRSEAQFVVDGGPQSIAPDLVISHESGSTLNLASIALVGDDAPLATESLSVQTVEGIAAQYDPQTGVLLLTGRATVADYQSVIRSLTYNNTGEDLVDRLVGISVTDSDIGENDNFSPRTLIDVNVISSASFAEINDVELGFGQAFSLNLETTAAGFDDATLTFDVTEAGALSDQLAVSDTNELILPVAAQAGTFDVTVVASDALGAQAEQTFTIDVAEFVPFEGIGALSNIPPEQRNDIYTEAPPQNIDTSLTYDAVLDTSQGDIRIRLLDDESPTFVNNFVNLARDGFYDGLTFHRVIDGFVGQGGDPLGDGTGGPGFEIPDEVANEIEFDARGQLSFANAGNDTTGSQFFITFAPTFLNNNQFSVFGNVIEGDAVLDSLTRTQTSGSIPIPGVTPDVISSIRIEEV